MSKTALITGASSGIGAAAASEFAKLGYNLVLTARRADKLQELADRMESEYGVKSLALGFDIRDRRATESAIDALPEHLQDICVLVNNAGLASGLEHINEGDYHDWDLMIDTNIKGLLYITRVVTIGMIERGHGGHIINIGSIAGVQTYEQGAVYCASKHAVHALSQGMRIDLLRHGIKVTEVRPGMVDTEFSNVRFHGDAERAKAVYENLEPLHATDVANVIGWLAALPPHVNVNEIEVTPIQQANVFYTHRK